MNRLRNNLVFVACVAAMFSGCADLDAQGPADIDALDVGLEPQAGGTREPPSGMNGDLPSCLWASSTQSALRTLANSKLDTGSGFLPPMPGVTGSCREIIRTAVKCALSRELSINDDIDPSDPPNPSDPSDFVTYEGWWGVAPEWLKFPLSTSGRRWVTACMIQKLNATGTQVPILMEGNTPPLYINATLDAEIPFNDSTAFGDMFSSTTPLNPKQAPFKVYVCTDSDLVTTCGNNLGSPWTQYRICDGVTNCGMTFIGTCSSVCTNVAGYWKCPDTTGVLWSETVHVQYEGFPGYCF